MDINDYYEVTTLQNENSLRFRLLINRKNKARVDELFRQHDAGIISAEKVNKELGVLGNFDDM